MWMSWPRSTSRIGGLSMRNPSRSTVTLSASARRPVEMMGHVDDRDARCRGTAEASEQRGGLLRRKGCRGLVEDEDARDLALGLTERPGDRHSGALGLVRSEIKLSGSRSKPARSSAAAALCRAADLSIRPRRVTKALPMAMLSTTDIELIKPRSWCTKRKPRR